MSEVNLQIGVGSLDALHRRALEEVLGRELAANQQLTISVSEVTPLSQSLEDWSEVYEGLSREEVDEIDRIVNTRGYLTRPLP